MINPHPNMLMVEDDSFGEKLESGADEEEIVTPASQLGEDSPVTVVDNALHDNFMASQDSPFGKNT